MKCNTCGEKATLKDSDPYFEELPELTDDDRDNEPEWWCNDCYKERLWAI